MLASYATGLIAIAIVTAAWVGVQIAWRSTFGGGCSDPDVLAGRMSCHGCDGTSKCRPRRVSDD